MYDQTSGPCDTHVAPDPRTPRYYEAMIAALLRRGQHDVQRFSLAELTQAAPVRYEYDPHSGVIEVSLMPVPVNATDAPRA